MKLEKLSCPSCGANIDIDVVGKKTFVCPYCDKQLSVDDGEKVITHNYNMTVDEHVHKEYSNNSQILKEQRKTEEFRMKINTKKMIVIAILAVIVLSVFGVGGYTVFKKISTNSSIKAGEVQIGHDAEWFVGKKCKSMEETLASQGFKNVKTIAIDDAGIFKNHKNTIESISINGSKYFKEDDYFKSDIEIIIYYHD